MSLIRMNLYRFVRTKAVYVLLLLTALFIVLAVVDQQTMSEEQWKTEMELLETEGIDVETSDEKVGVTLGLTPITSVYNMTTDILSSGLLLVFTGIFAALFSNAERNGGYLKNLNSCTQNKGWIFVAKGAPVAIFVLLGILTVICASEVSGLNMEGLFSKEFILYLIVQWVLHVAYGMFVLAVMEITRSLVAGMIIGIFFGMGVGNLAVNFIENIFHVNGLISSHMLVAVARALVPGNVMECLIPALLTGVIGVILYWMVGSKIFEKRDMY